MNMNVVLLGAQGVRQYLVLVAGLTAAVGAQCADVQGGADHPLVTRFSGSSLVGYFHRDWDATTFPLGKEVGDGEALKKAERVEGSITRLVYIAPTGRAPLEVFRNYEQAFAKAGLKTRFSCDGDCGQLFFHWRFGRVSEAMKWSGEPLTSAKNPARQWKVADALDAEEGRGFYGTLSRGGGETHVFVYTSIAGYTETNAAATVIEIAEPKAMQAGQVVVDAAALANGLVADGKVTLGGIYFDTGKAVLKPESDAQLTEMAKLLAAQPTLQVFVVGHTDNQGAFDANLKLSSDRAAAVRDALVGRFNVAAARVMPYGVASVAPVASNGDEAGRARNRRVELVAR
jgi:outer membrane protein OmpA-like peptidoglycan-associated protein